MILCQIRISFVEKENLDEYRLKLRDFIDLINFISSLIQKLIFL